MVKLYIAFSIQGTCKFTVATKEHTDGMPLPDGFVYGQSRNHNRDKKDGEKVLWSKLNRRDGTPMKDKGWVTKRFNELKALGWQIVPAKPHTC